MFARIFKKHKDKHEDKLSLPYDKISSCPVNYDDSDLHFAYQEVKHFNNKLNERNRKTMNDLIDMAKYFKRWLLAGKLFEEDDLEISYKFFRNSIALPKVVLTINTGSDKEAIEMGYNDIYKNNLLTVASILHKKEMEMHDSINTQFDVLIPRSKAPQRQVGEHNV